MAYLIVDPVGRYPAEMMPFLARQLNQGAVAVFSSRARLALWQSRTGGAKTADVNPCLRNITKFLQHGAENLNEISLVAPTGFEPVFESRSHIYGEVRETNVRRSRRRSRRHDD